MITDIYSRKIVGWKVHTKQSDNLSSNLIKRAYKILWYPIDIAHQKMGSCICMLVQPPSYHHSGRKFVTLHARHSDRDKEIVFYNLKLPPLYISSKKCTTVLIKYCGIVK